MKVLTFPTKGYTDIIDITPQVQKEIDQQGIKEGVIHLFVIGSTASLTTIEADKNLYDDLKEVLEKIAPYKKDWRHHQTWGDDNGASHLRASIFGPDLNVPIAKGELVLGTWQKIVLIDFDTRERVREVVMEIM